MYLKQKGPEVRVKFHLKSSEKLQYSTSGANDNSLSSRTARKYSDKYMLSVKFTSYQITADNHPLCSLL